MARKDAHEGLQGAHELEGRYANCFKVGRNAFEFVLLFGQCYAEDEEGQVHTMIVTSPTYAKFFWKQLGESIELYEKEYCTIADNCADDNQHAS